MEVRGEGGEVRRRRPVEVRGDGRVTVTHGVRVGSDLSGHEYRLLIRLSHPAPIVRRAYRSTTVSRYEHATAPHRQDSFHAVHGAPPPPQPFGAPQQQYATPPATRRTNPMQRQLAGLGARFVAVLIDGLVGALFSVPAVIASLRAQALHRLHGQR